jgi:hypothetical protein
MNILAFSSHVVVLAAVLSGASACGSKPDAATGRQAAAEQLSRGCGADAAPRQPSARPPSQSVVAMCR